MKAASGNGAGTAGARPVQQLSARQQRDREIQALIRQEDARMKSEKALFKQNQEAKEWGDSGGSGGRNKRKRKK